MSKVDVSTYKTGLWYNGARLLCHYVLIFKHTLDNSFWYTSSTVKSNPEPIAFSGSLNKSHIDIFPVDSNDKLYGADKKFIAEAVKIVDTLLKEILEELKEVGEKVKQNLLCFNYLIFFAFKNVFDIFCMLKAYLGVFRRK